MAEVLGRYALALFGIGFGPAPAASAGGLPRRSLTVNESAPNYRPDGGPTAPIR